MIAEKVTAQGIRGAQGILCALCKEWSEAEPRGNTPKLFGNFFGNRSPA
jgi:hypothetical protein